MKFIAVWQYKNSFTTALLRYKIYYQYKRQEFQTIIFNTYSLFSSLFSNEKKGQWNILINFMLRMKKAFDEMETLFAFLLMKQGKHVFLDISL